MKPVFEELDYQKTPLGDLSLRRRSELLLNGLIIYEVKLDDEFLMSSLFTASEIQLARLCLTALQYKGYTQNLHIIIGGLGLGYTAMAALESPAVSSLKVIEVMEPVINWHKQGLVPLGEALTSDPRCQLVHADFFEVIQSDQGITTDQQAHGLLLDIDHSPAHWLKDSNSVFYTEAGLANLTDRLLPGGVFGLWSNDPPDAEFIARLDNVFQSAESHVVSFDNPYSGGQSSCTVYLAHNR